ncbi:peptidoglycan-binding domain-containing protein [Chloracidobacterium thermophilum]|uniref:peptidoglycan-binding domain-containing protein n=1 Tax=Chloracidobacterium thermophilum TaxID=458033 RepID=UPI000738D3CA|nr:peptidoglycan-binding domain-containing protein [Chloracidobacterium thermophilum]
MLHRSRALCAKLALVIACLLVGAGLPDPVFPDAHAEEVIRPQKRRAAGQQRARSRRVRSGRSRGAAARSRRGRAARSRSRVSRTRGRSARMRSTRGRSYRSRSYRSRRGRVVRGRGGRAYRVRGGRYGRRGRYARRSRVTAAYGAPAAAPATPYRPPRSLVIPEARTREIQEKLREAGFYQGEITGQYDESTREAMRNFQRANGLKETGTPTAPALLRLGLTKHTSEAGDTSAPPVQLPPPTDQPPPQ